MDGIWSCNGWPYYLPSSSNLSAFASPFSVNTSTANGVPVASMDLAEFEEANASYGSGSFSNALGELDSAPFSKPNSHGYSGFQFMGHQSTQLPRVSSPDWSSLSTKSSEIEHSGQRPGSWNQVLELNKVQSKQVEVGGSFCSEESNIFGGTFKVHFSNQGPNNEGALDRNDFSNIKEASPMPISRSPVCSDQFHSHLYFEPTSSNNAMLSDWNVARDVVDYVFKAVPRILNVQANLDIEKSLDGVDECDPAVDSPCWNGAPAAHFSPFNSSEPSHPELTKEFDECLGSNLDGPKEFVIETENNGNLSFEISNKNQMQNEIDSQEKGLAGFAKLSVSNFSYQEYNSDGAENDGPSNAAKQVAEENKFMSQNQNSSCRCIDVGFNVIECLECSTSQEAEHGLSSPSFILGAPKKVAAPKIDIPMLIKMMHNMSELLLGLCLTDEFELNERDHSVLENVISNLCTCALKNAEQVIPVQKRISPDLDSDNFAVESPELQQNACVERPHLSKVGPEHAKVDLENLPVKDKKNRHFIFGREHRTILDSPCISADDTETKKADEMTKAIKRILSENFHEEEEPESQALLYKNLWLEAEAALCSINYRARYHRMIEMEKYSSKQRDNALGKGEPSKTEADLKLSLCQNSAIEVESSHSSEHISHLHAANLTEQSFLKFSPNLNGPIASQPEGEGSQKMDIFVQDPIVLGTSKKAENYGASVLAMFHVLKSQDDQSCINTPIPEDPSNSEDSGTRDIAPKLASGGTDRPKTQNQDRIRFAGDGSDASESESLMGNSNPETHDNFKTVVNGLILEEFYVENLEYKQEIQPGSSHRFGNQFVTVTDYSDSLSSDWEHV